MDCSDWSNGIRYHNFGTRPDTEFKLKKGNSVRQALTRVACARHRRRVERAAAGRQTWADRRQQPHLRDPQRDGRSRQVRMPLHSLLIVYPRPTINLCAGKLKL